MSGKPSVHRKAVRAVVPSRIALVAWVVLKMNSEVRPSMSASGSPRWDAARPGGARRMPDRGRAGGAKKERGGAPQYVRERRAELRCRALECGPKTAEQVARLRQRLGDRHPAVGVRDDHVREGASDVAGDSCRGPAGHLAAGQT